MLSIILQGNINGIVLCMQLQRTALRLLLQLLLPPRVFYAAIRRIS